MILPLDFPLPGLPWPSIAGVLERLGVWVKWVRLRNNPRYPSCYSYQYLSWFCGDSFRSRFELCLLPVIMGLSGRPGVWGWYLHNCRYEWYEARPYRPQSLAQVAFQNCRNPCATGGHPLRKRRLLGMQSSSTGTKNDVKHDHTSETIRHIRNGFKVVWDSS